MKLYRVAVAALWALAACQSPVDADVVSLTADVQERLTSAPSGTNLLIGPSGLTAAVYHRATATLQSPANSSAGVQEQVAYAASNAPAYTFLVPSTSPWSLSLNGGDATPTNQFFGADTTGAAAQDTAALQTTIVDLTGFVHFWCGWRLHPACWAGG